MNLSKRLFVSLFLGCIAPVCAETSLTFNLGSPGVTVRDQFIFTDGGVTATTTAFTLNPALSNATFQKRQIVQWNPGIGVRSLSELITPVPNAPYDVDDPDHYDFVLFIFSSLVDLTYLEINPSTEASYWLGNINTTTDLSGASFDGLTEFGFGSRIDTISPASGLPRTFEITTPTGGVNALLIGTRIGNAGIYDPFKIATVEAAAIIPEPTTAGLLVCSLALVLRRRRA